jgi:hypothetical protein
MATDSWGEIRANGSVMRYRRWRLGAGEGAAVVVLGSRLGVVVPELTDPASLGPFVEGLGTPGLTILAAGPFYHAALELAATDPERVARVSPLGAD